MKGLLICREKDIAWFHRFLPDHPLLLRVLNRPLLHHYAQFFLDRGVTEVRVLSEVPTADLESWLAQTPLPVHFEVRNVRTAENRLTLLNQQQYFLGKAEALIVFGLSCFLDTWQGLSPDQVTGEPTDHHLAPLWLTRQRELRPYPAGRLADVANLTNYFQLSLQLLRTGQPAGLSLKHIHPSAVLQPPLLVGDRVRVGPLAQIGPGVILAPGVQIERQAQLSQTIVYNPVKIGPRVELRDKIIFGHHIITPLNGAATPITDPHLLKPLRS